jgi:glycosyltransferase involved in cell wall biosynthesis
VLYLPRQAVSIRRLAREVAEWSPRAIYLNSFFDSIFTVKVLLARRFGLIPPVPALLAPQGEFSSGALGLKPAKKAVYIRLARMGGLYRDLIWQASNEAERQDILQTLQSVRPGDVRVAADLTDAVPAGPPARLQASVGTLRVCFLSRITPKKNLDFALRVLADVTAQVDFTIYGPIEDNAYWATCQAAIARLPPNVQARYGGEVLPALVRQTLGLHELFFFPTRAENFGHVIFEALSAGLPVLTSDQTPWNDLASHGAGQAVPLKSASEFARAIDAMSLLHPAEREALAERALAYARGRVDRPAAVRHVSALFRDLLRP